MTQQGTTKTTFTVASNRTWKDGDEQRREETEWFTVIAWSKLGEICGEYLRKGSHVYVSGRLHTRSWEDAASGQQRSRVEVIANDLIMLDAKPQTDHRAWNDVL